MYANAATVIVHAWPLLPGARLLPAAVTRDAKSSPPERNLFRLVNQAAIMNDPVVVKRLKNRRDFLAVKKGACSHGRAFVLQARKMADAQNNAGSARFGITVTKKVGNSVIRNRIKRRLREAIRLNAAKYATAGFDYVLIARKAALNAGFDELVAELSAGFTKVAKIQH